MMGVESAIQGESGKSAFLGGGSEAPKADTNVSEGAKPTGDADGAKSIDPVKTTQAAGVPGAQELPPAYSPNLKFKVMDKEYEFEEWAKNAIKDADTEKKVREFHEKAYGLDNVKQDRQTLRSENTQLKDQITQTDQTLSTIGGMVQRKDYDSFFDALKIPKADVLKYALELVKREQDPNYAAQWQQGYEQNRQMSTLQQQNEMLVQQQRQFALQTRTYELQTVMQRPDVMQAAQAYDAGMGNPGAFKDFVAQLGANAFYSQGKDLSADEAVTQALHMVRAMNPGMGQPQNQSTAQVVSPNQKPVIPNIQGRGTSPVKPTVKSLDDIRKLSKQLDAQ